MTRPRSGLLGDQAVSTVVGAILILAVVSIAFVTFRVAWVPVWEEDAEAAHMQLVDRQMSDFTHTLKHQTGNGTQHVQAGIITLQDHRTARMYDPVILPADLWLAPGAALTDIRGPSMLIQSQDGTSLLAIADTWAGIGSGGIAGAIDITHLRIRVPDPGAQSSGDTATITGRDSSNALLGSLTISVADGGGGTLISSETRDHVGAPVSSTSTWYHNTQSPAFHYIDALDPALGFAAILSASPRAVDLTYASSGLNASVSAGYRIANAEGDAIMVGGGGVASPAWSRAYSGGHLSYASNNNHFVSQTYLVEAGGLLLMQDGVGVWRVEPTFHAALVGTTLRVDIVLPTLTGEPQAHSGTRTVTVASTAGHSDSMSGLVPRFSINQTTAAPSAWQQLWEDRLIDAGLSEGAGHYNITTTAISAELTVYGLTSASSSTVNDIQLSLQQSELRLRIQP